MTLYDETPEDIEEEGPENGGTPMSLNPKKDYPELTDAINKLYTTNEALKKELPWLLESEENIKNVPFDYYCAAPPKLTRQKSEDSVFVLENVPEQRVLLGVFDGVSQKNGDVAAQLIESATNSMRNNKKLPNDPRIILNEFNTSLREHNTKEPNRQNIAAATGGVAKIQRKTDGLSTLELAAAGDISFYIRKPDGSSGLYMDPKAREKGSNSIVARSLGTSKELKYEGEKANATYKKTDNLPTGTIVITMSDGIGDILENLASENEEIPNGKKMLDQIIGTEIKNNPGISPKDLAEALINRAVGLYKEREEDRKKYPNLKQVKDDDKGIVVIFI